MNYYPFHIGDYISHTSHLSDAEDLAYRRMIDLYYQTEEPFTDVFWVARKVKSTPEIVEILLKEFFEVDFDGWRSKRADEEIAKYRAKADSARNANRVKTEKKSALITELKSELISEPNHNVTNNQEPITNINTYTHEFELFWKSYPRHEAKSAAMKAFKKVKVDIDVLLQAVAQQKTSKQWKENIIPHASTWLNQSRWEDEIITKPTNDIFSPQRTTA
tara:strand:- start:220 stop:876 length:657 start_codon:yes stop_codon:yes gene_type:complete